MKKLFNHDLMRIMIVGTPRSGTTLLQSLIATHPDIYTLPETHFFTGTAKKIPPGCAFLYRDPEKFAKAFLSSIGKPERLLPPSGFGVIRRAACVFNPSLLASYYLELLDSLARFDNKSIWLEKTPRHLHYIDWLEADKLSKTVTFVHIIRGHDATVRSIAKASKTWVRPMDHKAASRRWARDLDRHAKYVGREGHYFVRYEDISANPQKVMKKLYSELNLHFDPKDLELRVERSKYIIRESEHWKLNNLSAKITESSEKDTETHRLPLPNTRAIKKFNTLLRATR